MRVATKFTAERQQKFFDLLSELGNVSKACEMVPVTRTTVYKYRLEHEEFAAKWKEAETLAADALEDEAWRRAKEGVPRALSYQGQLTGDIVTDYSDTLLIFLLKGNKQEKFADRTKHDGVIRTENTVLYLPKNGRE